VRLFSGVVIEECRYRQLILSDLELASSPDIDNDMWTNAFYSVIELARKRRGFPLVLAPIVSIIFRNCGFRRIFTQRHGFLHRSG
jgi:hypothetical protein